MSRPLHRSLLMVAACVGIFFFGIVLALLGTVFGIAGMRERLGITLAQQGNLFLLLYFGVLLASLAIGPTIDRFGNKAVLVLSSLAVGVAMAAFAAARSFTPAAVAALLLGLGGGGLNTSTNALVSDLYEERRGAMLNILGIFFGFGGLCMPFVAATLASTFTIEQLLLSAAVPAWVAALAFATLAFPRAREAQSFSLAEAFRAARQPGVLQLAFLLLFASGNEAAVGGWTSTFLTQEGSSTQTATYILAGFWACLMAGRLLAAQLVERMGKERLVLLSTLTALAGCALLVLSPALPGRAAGVWIAGLAFAPIFPTTLAIAGDRFARFSGSVFSVLFTVALVGGMSFPWAIGQLAEVAGVRSGLILPIFGSAMIALLAWRIERAVPRVRS